LALVAMRVCVWTLTSVNRSWHQSGRLPAGILSELIRERAMAVLASARARGVRARPETEVSAQQIQLARKFTAPGSTPLTRSASRPASARRSALRQSAASRSSRATLPGSHLCDLAARPHDQPADRPAAERGARAGSRLLCVLDPTWSCPHRLLKVFAFKGAGSGGTVPFGTRETKLGKKHEQYEDEERRYWFIKIVLELVKTIVTTVIVMSSRHLL
jgi:hypothetical protein